MKKTNSMKNFKLIIFFLGFITLATSCQKWLDVNKNPNNPEASVVSYDKIYSQAIAYTASTMAAYNSYGAQLNGYIANAGGYGSLGTLVSYAITGNNFGGLWSSSYDNLEDYVNIIQQTEGNNDLLYYNASAKIMSCLLYAHLVDAYNDVPYTNSLQGLKSLTPKYDSAKVIYASLVDTLNRAIAEINTGATSSTIAPITAKDILFAGNMTNWKQLANTIKLRLFVKAFGKINFKDQSFSSDGFLTADALINPGYSQSITPNGASQQNPAYDGLIFNYQGTAAYKVWLPSTYIMSFYNGNKLLDQGRGAAMYYNYPNSLNNQMGNQNNSVPSCPDGTVWWPTSTRTPGSTTGAFKGPNAGFPLITAAESYFLQAEAALNGIITGQVDTLFYKGMAASFNYVYMLPTKTVSGNPANDVLNYRVTNNTSPLVNFALATTNAQKLEAIITQKYIALNMITSDQAWDDYRRTQYPTIISTPNATGTQTFASILSLATRPDHLPSRLAYPTSEVAYNTANMPKNISVYTSLIFWAKP